MTGTKKQRHCQVNVLLPVAFSLGGGPSFPRSRVFVCTPERVKNRAHVSRHPCCPLVGFDLHILNLVTPAVNSWHEENLRVLTPLFFCMFLNFYHLPPTAHMWIIGCQHNSAKPAGSTQAKKRNSGAPCRWNVEIDANANISITTRFQRFTVSAHLLTKNVHDASSPVAELMFYYQPCPSESAKCVK